MIKKKGIVVSQGKYIPDLLKEMGMSGCRPMDTPMDPNQKLGNNKKRDALDASWYQKLLGKANLLITHTS